jgi:4-amino-4-deoxy-L-arabinose transferase-like glycosyltransferase
MNKQGLGLGGIAAIAWIVALHGLLAWLSFGGEGRHLVGDEYHYFVAAGRLLATGTLVLDPLWPPLYPWFLAAVFRLGADHLVALAVVQGVLLLVAALALRTIVAKVLANPRAGNYALLGMLGYPNLAAFAYYAWPEVLFLALLLPALALLVARPNSNTAAAGAGLLCGGALLCKLVFWPAFVLLVAALVLLEARRSAAIVLAVATLTSVAAAPVLRPDAVVARPDTNIAFNVLLGLKDRSRRTFVDSIAKEEWEAYLASGNDADERSEVLYAKIAALLRERGIAATLVGQLGKQYARLLDPESYLTAQLPGGALASTPMGYKGVSHATATLVRVLAWGSWLGLLALAVIGALARPWRSLDRAGQVWMGWFAAFLGYNLAIFFFLHVVSRYRIALLPTFFLFAVAAVFNPSADRQPKDGG